jgi:hypothetical protein
MTVKSTSNIVKFSTNGGEATLFTNGNFGVNVKSASAKLHVGGDTLVDGTVTANDYYSPSDRRLKTNVSPIKNALTKVLNLRGVTYTWNQEAKSLSNDYFKTHNSTQIGLIAQEVESVLPELVHTWSIENKTDATNTSQSDGATDETKSAVKEYKAVDYSKLSAVLIEAMREQRQMFEDMEKELRALEVRTDKLS